MKQQTFTLPEQSPVRVAKIKLIKSRLDELPEDARIEVVFRNAHISKTMEQLGALFGVWIEYLVEQTGYSENELHRMMKSKCLARIYITEPVGAAQEQWVELLAIYQMEQHRKYEQHAKRISLSWANLPQMKAYMDCVERYWISKGYPLPQPEKKRNG